jgi:hypothetical protein
VITLSPEKIKYSPRGIEKIFLQEKRNFPYGKENNPFEEEERLSFESNHILPWEEIIFSLGDYKDFSSRRMIPSLRKRK